MVMARITLWGFYQYYPSLFDDVIFPSDGDLHTLIDLIMERSGELYPYHQQPVRLKNNINAWFNRKYNNFTKMFSTLLANYDPIENYDRKEDWTDRPDVNTTHTGGYTDSGQGRTTGSDENKVSAYNSEAYEPNSLTNGSSDTNSQIKRVYENEVIREHGTRNHVGRVHGNIGVTTNQQMINQELQLRMYDIYDVIAKNFENDFLTQVY